MNFSLDAVPLAPRLHKLEAVLANYDVDNLVTVEPEVMHDVPFNWKIMVENFMEMYHNSRLHNGIHDFAPSSGAWYQDYEAGDGAPLALTRWSSPMVDSIRPLKRCSALPGITMEERQRIVFAFVPPTLLLGFQPDSAFCLRSTQWADQPRPLDGVHLPRVNDQREDFNETLDEAIDGVANFVRQDMPTNVATQLGLRSLSRRAAATVAGRRLGSVQ